MWKFVKGLLVGTVIGYLGAITLEVVTALENGGHWEISGNSFDFIDD